MLELIYYYNVAVVSTHNYHIHEPRCAKDTSPAAQLTNILNKVEPMSQWQYCYSWPKEVSVQLKVDSKMLKSPMGIVAALVIIALALGYMHWRRGRLIRQGAAQVQSYLQTELQSAYMREHTKPGATRPDPEELNKLKQVKVLEFSPSYFFRTDRRGRVRVQAVVQVGDRAPKTHYFFFRKTLGGWRLQRETSAPLLQLLR